VGCTQVPEELSDVINPPAQEQLLMEESQPATWTKPELQANPILLNSKSPLQQPRWPAPPQAVWP
jgi:hypothetical protein